MKGYFFLVNPGNREEELRCYEGVRGLTAAVATQDKLILVLRAMYLLPALILRMVK